MSSSIVAPTDKRAFLRTAAGGGLGLLLGEELWAEYAAMPVARLAEDETFWSAIRDSYRLKPDYLNLENGCYCIQAQPVLEAFVARIYTEASMLAVRPDGRYAYAVNNQTKDITVVDAATGKSAGMIGGNGYALELLGDGRSLYEVSDSELRLNNLEQNQKAQEIPLPGLRGVFFSPDRSVAVALAKQAVLVIDGTTGKELARLADFTSPSAIAFASAPLNDATRTGASRRPRRRTSQTVTVRRGRPVNGRGVLFEPPGATLVAADGTSASASTSSTSSTR